MKKYLQPICEMMELDPHEDILTTSNTLFTKVEDNQTQVDSITW